MTSRFVRPSAGGVLPKEAFFGNKLLVLHVPKKGVFGDISCGRRLAKKGVFFARFPAGRSVTSRFALLPERLDLSGQVLDRQGQSHDGQSHDRQHRVVAVFVAPLVRRA
ncbi:MAG: hypothetical protein RI949_259 [Pseudomonadota bacterium]